MSEITNQKIVFADFDVSDRKKSEEFASKVADEFGRVDIVINNAGVGHHGPVHELSHQERNRILQINLNAPFALFQHLFQQQQIITDL